MFASRLAHLVAGKAVYGFACFLAVLAIVVAGYAHTVARLVNSTGQGIAIDGSPSVGAMNILVMGLESRTDYDGNTLPESLLTAMHAGNASAVSEGEVGAQDTNTLILVHIFAGGQKAVGFSIPRDDLVNYPHATLDGITQGKIDQAYDFAYNQSLGQTYGSSMSQDQRYTEANQAGQAFEIATVQAVTGVHVDHFVEVNLAGFFYLAQAFGGIEVCVQPWSGNDGANLADDSSGWDAVADGYNLQKGGPQYLHLAADQALAFVRARDTLPGTDLGRTKRQQAVIDYVIWELKHRNVFSDLGTLNSLLGIASQYLRTDSTFNLLDFATDMRSLTGRHVSFITLPISGQVNDMELNGSLQDVNTIDVPYVQSYVHNAFYPPTPTNQPAPKTTTTTPAPPASTVTVDVYNGSGAAGLAGSVSQALTALGYQAGVIANASSQSQSVESATQVFYGAGAAANAAIIASKTGATATALSSVPAGHIEVLLGSTVTAVPSGLTSSSTSTGATQSSDATESPAPSASSTAAANDGATGGVLTVPPSAPFGIPCVY
jgi:LCP family protein required for cell wall assembly